MNPLHIGAVDGDSLWRCYDKTKSLYLYFAIKRDLLLLLFITKFICSNIVEPLGETNK